MTETQYNNALAIYNPNGGWNTGKLYNLKNVDGVAPTYDIDVKGGGGTRLNKDGLVENVEYYNLMDAPTNDGGGAEWSKGSDASVTTTSFLNGEVAHKITSLNSDSSSYMYFEKSVNATHNWSIHLKGPAYCQINVGNIAGTRYRKSFLLDLANGSIYGTQTPEGENFLEVNDIRLDKGADGWYRFSCSFEKSNAIFVISTKNSTWANETGLSVEYYGAQVTKGSKLHPFKSGPTPEFPKLDYTFDKVTFLFEPERINHLKSNDSSGYNVTTSNDGTLAPDGLNEATKVTDSNGFNFHQYSTSTAINAVGTYTFSCYIKFPENGKNIGISPINSSSVGNTAAVIFNNTGTIVSNTSNLINTIKKLPNSDWYRVSATTTSTDTGNWGCTVRIYDGTEDRYSADGTSFYIWGKQLEAGNILTSYIPTTDAVVTVPKTYYELPNIINSFPFEVDFGFINYGGSDMCNILASSNPTDYQGLVALRLDSDDNITVTYGDGGGSGSGDRRRFISDGPIPDIRDGNEHKIIVQCIDFNTVKLYHNNVERTISHVSGTATGISFDSSTYYVNEGGVNHEWNSVFGLTHLIIRNILSTI